MPRKSHKNRVAQVRREDPILASVFKAAVETFREQGFASTNLAQVAERAHIAPDVIEGHFADKAALFAALLDWDSPLPDLLMAFDQVQGESTEDILRDAMRHMVKAVEAHPDFLELAAIDMQINNGSNISGLTAQIVPKALTLLKRLKATGELRPVADPILARTLVSLFMGFIISERVMPEVARMAMRMFGQRAWLDGMVDLLLFGVLEDDAR